MEGREDGQTDGWMDGYKMVQQMSVENIKVSCFGVQSLSEVTLLALAGDLCELGPEQIGHMILRAQQSLSPLTYALSPLKAPVKAISPSRMRLDVYKINRDLFLKPDLETV